MAGTARLALVGEGWLKIRCVIVVPRQIVRSALLIVKLTFDSCGISIGSCWNFRVSCAGR